MLAALVYIPTNSVGGLLFSTPSPTFVICILLNDGHSDWSGDFHALEKEMATLSSVLAWRILMDRGAW